MKSLSKFVQRFFLGITISLSTVNYIAIPSYGQDLETIFSGQDIPLTLKLKDLDNNWRKISVNGQFEMGDLIKTWVGFLDSILNIKTYNNAYFTQGKTVTIGNNNYLIAYRIPLKSQPLNLTTFFGNNSFESNCEQGSLPVKLSLDTEVSLALLNLDSAGSFNDILPLNVKQEIAESENQHSMAKLICQQNLIEKKNKEGLNSLGSINRAQQAYHFEMSSFTNSLDELGVALSRDNFNYSIEVKNNAVFNYVTAKDQDINSYVGGMLYDSEFGQYASIICQSENPTTKKLPQPIIKENEITCPPNTILVE